MAVFRIEGCLTQAIQDPLKNGLWVEFKNSGLHLISDQNIDRINQLFDAACGIKAPITGNFVYDEEIFWELSELKRSEILNHKCSVFSLYELERMHHLSVSHIIRDDLLINNFSRSKIKDQLETILSQFDLSSYRDRLFTDLSTQQQYQVLGAKLLWKNPRFVHLNLSSIIENEFFGKDFLEYFEKLFLDNNVVGIAYINNTDNLLQSHIVNLSDERNFFAADMIYSIKNESQKIHNWTSLIIRNMLRSLLIGFNLEKLYYVFWFILTAAFMTIAGFLNSFDFNETFSLHFANFDLNAFLRAVSLLVQIAASGFYVFLFARRYQKHHALRNFLIAKGFARIVLINNYLVIVVYLFIFSTLINLIINLSILFSVAQISFQALGVLWPIVVLFIINTSALIPYYLYTFKTYNLNINDIVHGVQKIV
ncbi:hypothetical protein [[Mycoplasma] testudinis]|uniref:hypothetical protein n=1 Tax=[Mycoplasma] testudinis TaxID=33924 RepID=UPI00048A12B4|nr:hypothetical protein [[Mycoplasma] testudinis]